MMYSDNQQLRIKLVGELYTVTNCINNKFYVGVTRGKALRRWSNHKAKALQGSDYRLHKAIRKYGGENFNFCVVASILDNSFLEELEILWIRDFKPEYNMTPGGYGWSEFQRDANRTRMLGRVHTWGSKISAAMKQRVKSNPEFLLENAKRARYARRKWYKIRFPTGVITVVGNLRGFCEIHNLEERRMHDTLIGRFLSHKGFKVLSKFNDYPETEYAQVGGSGELKLALA